MLVSTEEILKSTPWSDVTLLGLSWEEGGRDLHLRVLLPGAGARLDHERLIVLRWASDLVVKLEVPGMKREDITVTFENNVLTVAGERKLSEDVKREEYHRRERVYGTFRRGFTLPSSVDGGRVHAAYADGVLTITLPQRAEAKPRQIAVEG